MKLHVSKILIKDNSVDYLIVHFLEKITMKSNMINLKDLCAILITDTLVEFSIC